MHLHSPSLLLRLLQLQPIPTLLHRLPIRHRLPARLQPALYIRPLPPLRPQLGHQDKLDAEHHHRIRSRDVLSAQKLASGKRQLRLEPVQILLHVDGEPLLRRVEHAVVLRCARHGPARVRYGERVQHEGRFRRVDPLHDFDALVHALRHESALSVIPFAQVPVHRAPTVSSSSPQAR